MKPASLAARSSTCSTSSPSMVSFWQISDADAVVSRCSFSQERVNFIGRALPLSFLPHAQHGEGGRRPDGEPTWCSLQRWGVCYRDHVGSPPPLRGTSSASLGRNTHDSSSAESSREARHVQC